MAMIVDPDQSDNRVGMLRGARIKALGWFRGNTGMLLFVLVYFLALVAWGIWSQ
jgi:hypothetical protein